MIHLASHLILTCRYWLLLVGAITLLPACSIYDTNGWNGDDDDVPASVAGMRPVYGAQDAYDIYSDVVRAIENGSSVFESGNLLFTVDLDRGIHVADNSNPGSPRRLTFIRILGVRTASVSGDFLYANNFEDFVTIDISNLDEVREIDRDAGFYDRPPSFPPNYNGFFECYDESRGPLVRWEQTTLRSPQCRI